MAQKSLRFCKHSGCCNLATQNGYCETHKYEEKEKRLIYEQNRKKAMIKRYGKHTEKRESSSKRGYTWSWAKYSKSFLSKAENKFCCLRLDDGCTIIADCVDHIDPPTGAGDKLFWNKQNHQPACIHCNSVKGHKKIKGKFIFAQENK